MERNNDNSLRDVLGCFVLLGRSVAPLVFVVAFILLYWWPKLPAWLFVVPGVVTAVAFAVPARSRKRSAASSSWRRFSVLRLLLMTFLLAVLFPLLATLYRGTLDEVKGACIYYVPAALVALWLVLFLLLRPVLYYPAFYLHEESKAQREVGAAMSLTFFFALLIYMAFGLVFSLAYTLMPPSSPPPKDVPSRLGARYRAVYLSFMDLKRPEYIDMYSRELYEPLRRDIRYRLGEDEWNEYWAQVADPSFLKKLQALLLASDYGKLEADLQQAVDRLPAGSPTMPPVFHHYGSERPLFPVSIAEYTLFRGTFAAGHWPYEMHAEDPNARVSEHYGFFTWQMGYVYGFDPAGGLFASDEIQENRVSFFSDHEVRDMFGMGYWREQWTGIRVGVPPRELWERMVETGLVDYLRERAVLFRPLSFKLFLNDSMVIGTAVVFECVLKGLIFWLIPSLVSFLLVLKMRAHLD